MQDWKHKSSYSKGAWKIVFRYLFQYKKEIVAVSILGVISAFANGSIPYIVGKFFDAILDSSRNISLLNFNVALWIFLLSLWALIQLVANAVDWAIYLKREKLDIKLFTTYLPNSFEHILNLPISFHKEEKTGSILSNINFAGNWMAHIISDVIINLTPKFLSIIVGTAFVFYINSFAGLIIAVAIILYIAGMTRVMRPAAELQRKRIQGYNDAYGEAYQAVNNIEPIKYFTAEKYVSERIRRKFVNTGNRFQYKLYQLWGGLDFYQRLIVLVTQFLIFILSVLLIQQGEMTIGELIAVNGYAAMMFGPFVTLGRNWQTIQNGIISVEEAQKILDTKKEVYKPKDAVYIKNVAGDIELKNVYFSYRHGEEKLLQNINIKINAGEVAALVGSSGVGKSTLVGLIGGYYMPLKGEVLIDGNNIRKLDLKFLRENIAVVPQEILLFNDTVFSNLKFAKPSASKEEIIKAAKEARADEFIQKFPKGYNSKVGERGVKLSVGQKQRIAIARAILRDPKILILDEPTSALDSKTEHELTRSLEKLMKGRTTIIIAHRLSTVRRADKIIVLSKGKITETGSHSELIQIPNGVYRELYNLQRID